MTILILTLIACGGGNPIDKCDSMSIDCCGADADCADFYGNLAPFCTTPGDTTGVCAECIDDSDCASGEVCDLDGPGVCLPE
jgi:Cys-rich repeat protein